VSPWVDALLPEVGTEAEGSLERGYAFVRHYAVAACSGSKQQGDGVHQDSATVTVNIPLSRSENFVGGNLSFCGVFGRDDYRRHVHTLDWSHLPLGTAILHSGLRRHAALPTIVGERMNLIFWAISSSPKAIPAGPWETRQVPDQECLSELYDSDFKQHSVHGHNS